MSLVKGKNVVLQFYDQGLWQPLACSKGCTLTTNSETGETSTLDSGVWRTYRAIKNNWTVETDGIVSMDMNMALRRLRDIQFALQAILIKFDATDDNGLIENYSGYIILTTISTPATVSGMYEYSVSGLGSGSLNITDVPVDPNAGCNELWYYYDGVGGERTTGPIPAIATHEIAGRIYRDGSEYRPSGPQHDGSGIPDPNQKEFAYNIATGAITFSNGLPPLEPGEHVDIPYLICEDVVYDCIPVQIEQISLPDGAQNQPYSESISISGTAPFVISNIVAPYWMTIEIVEGVVVLHGTPDTSDTDIPISFSITNCNGASDTFDDTIDIIPPPDVQVSGVITFACSDGGGSHQGLTSIHIDFPVITPIPMEILFGEVTSSGGGNKYTGNDIFTPPAGTTAEPYYGGNNHLPFTISVPANINSGDWGLTIAIYLRGRDGTSGSEWICHSGLFPITDLWVKINTDGYVANFTTTLPGVTIHNV